MKKLIMAAAVFGGVMQFAPGMESVIVMACIPVGYAIGMPIARLVQAKLG